MDTARRRHGLRRRRPRRGRRRASPRPRAHAPGHRPEPDRRALGSLQRPGDDRGRRFPAAARTSLGGRGRGEPGAAPPTASGRGAVDRDVRPRRPVGRGARGPAPLPCGHGRRVGGVGRPRDERRDPSRRCGVAQAGVHEGRVRRDAAAGGRANSGAVQTGGPDSSRMVTVDRVVIRAPIDRVLHMAADVERWPQILSHYRWVRFLERRNGGGTVEMAAWRPLGAFPYPTRWGSERIVDRRGPGNRYPPRPGATAGGGDSRAGAGGGAGAGLAAGTWAVGEITRFDPAPFRSRIAAEIPDFRPQDHLDVRRAKRLDRFSQLAVTSARFALTDAALDPAREDRDQIGVMIGSALGGVAFAESQIERFRAEGPRGLDPAPALAVFPGAASCNIAIEFGCTGPNSTNAMSCASGTIAVGEAFHTIREGRADVMIAGGAEAPLAPMTYAAFSVIRAMSTRNDDPAHASRPFDEDRDGFVMGEGAAVLVLEERERAVARGARIYAELAGYAFTNDAYHMTAPRPDGRQAARAMQLALADARVAPVEVGYINAHGSSTPLNDATETAAIKQVFGDHAYRLSVSGTKGYYGHALGASGAIEVAICALAMERRWLPPTINLERPDPACDLDCLRGEGRAAAPDVVLTNSFGFGGINAAVVLRRPD